MIGANHIIQCVCTSQVFKVCWYGSKFESVSVRVKILKCVCTSEIFEVCLYESKF